MMQKQTKYRLCETLCILVLTFSLSGCTKNMADTISTTEINQQIWKLNFLKVMKIKYGRKKK